MQHTRNPLGQPVRAIANWLNLATPLGLVVARAGRARLRRGPDRLWIGEGYGWAFPKAGAFTIGSVVITPHQSLDTLVGRNPDLWEHERAHALQWALCLGLPFLPFYLLATIWSQLRTGTNHGANFFEVQAGLAKGGYRPSEPVQRTFRRAAERFCWRCSRSRRNRLTSSGS